MWLWQRHICLSLHLVQGIESNLQRHEPSHRRNQGREFQQLCYPKITILHPQLQTQNELNQNPVCSKQSIEALLEAISKIRASFEANRSGNTLLALIFQMLKLTTFFSRTEYPTQPGAGLCFSMDCSPSCTNILSVRAVMNENY